MKLYNDMFEMCFAYTSSSLDDRVLILNRSHIGENVYAPMYRHTSGEWIFNIEKMWKRLYQESWKTLNLITFIDKPENLIDREDGLSFSTDIEKKKEEIQRFISTTNQSNIENKYLIDICDKDIKQTYTLVKKHLNLGD